MPRNDAILWIDLETTGSSDAAKVVEFGAAITDQSSNLYILDEFTATLREDDTPWEAEVVNQMHMKSGLAEDLKTPDYTDVGDLEKAVLRWINNRLGFSTEHIPWGGSGVGHFDSKYIRRDFPYLSKRLTYWVYDVGVMRRMLRLVGIEYKSGDAEIKTHRALDDIRLHIEEAREYLRLLEGVKSGNTAS